MQAVLAGAQVVCIGPTFATAGFLEFFKLVRALRVTLPGVVHLFVVYGYQGAEEDTEKLQLSVTVFYRVLKFALAVVFSMFPVFLA